MQGEDAPGWACSQCRWRFPLPTLLAGKEAKDAYDRLANAKFREHICDASTHPPIVTQNAGPTFADRARELIRKGYRPKVAVELVMGEIALECRNHAATMEQARSDGEDFLLKIRKGLI